MICFRFAPESVIFPIGGLTLFRAVTHLLTFGTEFKLDARFGCIAEQVLVSTATQTFFVTTVTLSQRVTMKGISTESARPRRQHHRFHLLRSFFGELGPSFAGEARPIRLVHNFRQIFKIMFRHLGQSVDLNDRPIYDGVAFELDNSADIPFQSDHAFHSDNASGNGSARVKAGDYSDRAVEESAKL